MTNFIFLFAINQAILHGRSQGTQITKITVHESKSFFTISVLSLHSLYAQKQGISTYALLRLILPISSTFSVSSDSAMYSLSSAHCDAAPSNARSTLPAFTSIKSLHRKSALLLAAPYSIKSHKIKRNA